MQHTTRQNLFIDIETIPTQSEDALEYLTQKDSPPANYKNEEAIQAWRERHTEEIRPKTALSGLWGEIVSVAWAVDNQPIRWLLRGPVQPEGDYLKEIGERITGDLSRLESRYQSKGYLNPRWIGFNLAFDTRFLQLRCLHHSVRFPLYIPVDQRPWSDTIFDVQYHLAGIQTRGFSLDACARALGVGVKYDMDAEDIETLWVNQDNLKIRDYNMRDVELTRKLFERITAWRSDDERLGQKGG